MDIRPIARVHNDFPEKFGLPRQAALLSRIPSLVVFEKEYRDKNALRGIEGFDRLWLIWGFDPMGKGGFSPTVRPPRLGGNVRLGVFATRSPNRPNPLALSCVILERVEWDTPRGPVLHILGADMTDGSAVYDIKPYLPGADAFPDARGGFAAAAPERSLEVVFAGDTLGLVPEDKRGILFEVLRQDPRPAYREGGDYGLSFADMNIRFTVDGNRLTVTGIGKRPADETDTRK